MALAPLIFIIEAKSTIQLETKSYTLLVQNFQTKPWTLDGIRLGYVASKHKNTYFRENWTFTCTPIPISNLCVKDGLLICHRYVASEHKRRNTLKIFK